MKQLTFYSLRSQLRSNHSLDERAKDLNTLIGAAASLLGDTSVGGFGEFISALAEKDKVINLCATVLQKILSRNPDDYSGRIDQMREAYGILCFTSFFDELDKQLPDGIRQNLQLGLPEKENLFRQTIGQKMKSN